MVYLQRADVTATEKPPTSRGPERTIPAYRAAGPRSRGMMVNRQRPDGPAASLDPFSPALTNSPAIRREPNPKSTTRTTDDREIDSTSARPAATRVTAPRPPETGPS